ncbi:MAG: amidase [Alphaproteobacteria bacterium]|nr:amidase [Alphaproteobacteria bacterium]
MLLLSATELARRIAAGEVTSREVVRVHIDRIRYVNPRIHAVVADRFDAALAEADAADAAVRDGRPLGPFHGVPCTIKESFAVTGMPNTAGLRARVGTISDADAVTVRRLRDAGALVMGVTNLSELCMWMESDNPVYGRTSNPYDTRRIAGGSSGGEGAVIGAGASPFGLGADVGGSIRMPAFFNGVFGHKPGSGVVPNSGQFPINHTEAGLRLLATGPLARRAEDLWPLLTVLAGPDGEDTVCSAAPLGDPADVDLAGLTVLDVPDNGNGPVHAQLRGAQVRVAAALGARGAVVQPQRFARLAHSFDLWSTALGDAEGKGAFRTLMRRPRRRHLVRHLVHPAELGGHHTLPATILGLVEDVGSAFPARAEAFRDEARALRAEIVDALDGGVMLYPSYPRTAPRHRWPWLTPLRFVYTAVFNALGLPVTQVPLGLDSRGVPLGVQIVGAPGHDHVTIAVAQALQDDGVAGWVPPPRL